MNIFLIGYGKMGKLIGQLAAERGHSICAISDEGEPWPVMHQDQRPDVAIEFTRPESAVANIKRCIDMGLPVVAGTTGWLSHLDEVREYCQQHSGSVMYGSNYSKGVNLWLALIGQAAEWFGNMSDYGVFMEETHHAAKLDAPSGTAIAAAEAMLPHLKSYAGWTAVEESGKMEIKSFREGEVPGTHRVFFRSAIDQIEITHVAGGREGFAQGAIDAAEWLLHHQGFYCYADVFA